jgi:hypothetical protein
MVRLIPNGVIPPAISGQRRISVAGDVDEASPTVEWKESQMSYVLCAVDESGSEEAVRAAIEFCLDGIADLKLVGIVEDKLTDSTRATAGERVRRYKMVSLGLDRAAEAARRAGVAATTTVRAGSAIEELAREADAVGSGELFFIRTRGRIGAALARKPRRELAHVSLGAATVAELAKAA